MKLPLVVRRWRALRAAALTSASQEGTVVRVTGIARVIEGDEPMVPPLAGVPCVVAWTKLTTPGQSQRSAPLIIERMQLRPFVIETDDAEIEVDTSHVDLALPSRFEGRLEEISVPDGATITVIGTVLRDGAYRPDDDIAFRETTFALKLVGSRRHPIVITASVSDTPAG